MSVYSEKLRDPRWQRRRLEILNRDDFTCQNCSDKTSTLHVHHCFYRSELEPWDYPLSSLVTLCECCHEEETADWLEARKRLNLELSENGFLVSDFDNLAITIWRWNKRKPRKRGDLAMLFRAMFNEVEKMEEKIDG